MRTQALNKLSATAVKSAGDGMHSDGGGLFLRVKNGRKSWVFRFTRDGRKREMGLGGLDTVTLAKARTAATEARQQVSEGLDPIAERDRPTEVDTVVVTFRQAVTQFLDANAPTWKNAKHRQQWQNTLDTYAAPLMAHPVQQVATADVVACLLPIWHTKAETARRARGRIERVMSAQIALGNRPAPNPAAWKDNLEHVLPRQKDEVVHHAAVPVDQVPEAFARLWECRQDGQGAAALVLGIMGAMRSGEVRGLLWSDVQGDLIVIPRDRMKAGKEHRIPITPQMREHLDDLPRFKGCALVFPSNRMGQISDMTMKAAMRRCDLGQYTPHGWRSSFSDWANRDGFRREHIEDALAHIVGSRVERAYRRGDFLEHRQELTQKWCDYLFSGL